MIPAVLLPAVVPLPPPVAIPPVVKMMRRMIIVMTKGMGSAHTMALQLPMARVDTATASVNLLQIAEVAATIVPAMTVPMTTAQAVARLLAGVVMTFMVGAKTRGIV